LRGQYPSYRELLLRLCYKLEIKCPSTLITEVSNLQIAYNFSCPLGLSSLTIAVAMQAMSVAGVCALKIHSTCLQDLETEVLMHILEQQEQSASPAALQKASQSSKKPAE